MSSSELVNRPPSSGSSIIAPQEPEATGGIVHISGTGLAGNGTVGDPLHTVAGGTAVAVDGTTIGGNGTTGDPLHVVGSGGASPMFLPGNWTATAIPASDDEDLAIASGFAAVVMQRAGSIVGISAALSDAITGGSLTLTVTKNGTPVTLANTQSVGSQPQFGHKTQSAELDTYVAGDRIGVHCATSSDFAKADSVSIVAFIEAQE